MFDYLKNLTKSEEEQRQEAAAAYLDNALSPKDKAEFENQLEVDKRLNEELSRQRWVKEQLHSLPAVNAPRNYMLDPAKFSAPASQISYRIYPALRTATIVAAILFVFLIGLDQFTGFEAGQEPTTHDSIAEYTEEESVSPPVVISESEEFNDIPVEEAPVADEQELGSAQPQPAEIAVEATVVVEAEVEMEEAAPPAEPAEGSDLESVQADDRSPDRLPGVSTDGVADGESSSGSILSDETIVAPLSPSGPVGELEEPTPIPDSSPAPAETQAGNLFAPVQTEEPSLEESSPETIPETVAEIGGEDVAPSPTADVFFAEPLPEEAADPEIVVAEDLQLVDSSGLQSGLSSADFVQIALGIGLLVLLTATLVLRRKLR